MSMKPLKLSQHFLSLAAMVAAISPALGQTSTAIVPRANYKVTGSIPIPDGSWDYARVDSKTSKLYVARNESVTVVDLTTRAVSSIGAIVHGHAVVPLYPGPLLLVTSGRDDSVRLIDTVTGAEKARIAVGNDPDAAAYDPRTGRAYVMNAKAGTVSVIDISSVKVIDTVALKPGLEFSVGSKSTIYVNNEEANEIETIDLATGKAGATIALTGCAGPTGLGFDRAHKRLISACANGKAAVTDLVTGTVTLLPIGLGPDAVIVDSERGRAFIPCGKDGTLVVIDISGSGLPTAIAKIPTEKGARTGALNPVDGTIYLPTARFTPPATPGGKPVAIPGSAHILVVIPQ